LLTRREQQADLIAQGMSDKGMAAAPLATDQQRQTTAVVRPDKM